MISRPAVRPSAPAKLVRTAPARVAAPPPFKHLLAMSLAAPKVKGAVVGPHGVEPKHVAATRGHETPATKHEHRHDRDDRHERDHERERARTVDPLDPAVRTSAALAPPPSPIPAGAGGEQVTARARVSLEDLLPLVVRRIAWGGDRTKAAVHVELAGGAFAGTTVTVHAVDGPRRVRLEVGGDGDHDALRERLESRLRRAGIEVEGVR